MGATALLSAGALLAAGTASAATMPATGGWASHHRHHHKEFECHFRHLGDRDGAFALVCHEESHHHHWG